MNNNTTNRTATAAASPLTAKEAPPACYDKENRKNHLPRQNPFQRNEQRNHERQNQVAYFE